MYIYVIKIKKMMQMMMKSCILVGGGNFHDEIFLM